MDEGNLGDIPVPGGKAAGFSALGRADAQPTRGALDLLPDPVFVLAPDGTVLAANAAMARATGVDRGAVLGRPFAALVAHPEDPEEARCCDDPATLLTGERTTARFALSTTVGQPLAVEVHASRGPFGDEPAAVICVGRDLSDQLATERALRQSEELYRSLYETALVGLFRTDLNTGLVLRANDAAARLVGLRTGEEAEAAGVRMDRLYASDRRRKLLRLLAARGEVSDFEIRLELGAGRTRDIAISARAYPERGYMEGVVVDISDRVAALAALRASEERFRTIIESTPMGVHMYELDDAGELRFTGANPAAELVLGLDHRPLLGKTVEEAFPGIAGTELPARYRLAAEQGVPFQVEQVVYKDERIGGAFDVHAFQAGPGRMVAMFNDVTERRRTEQELSLYRSQLEELVEARTRELRQAQDELVRKERLATLGQVTATVSHELRNPLSTIRTAVFSVADALERGRPGPVKRALALAERNVVRCDRIIDELLDFTRGRDPTPEPLELGPWLTELLDELPLPPHVTVRAEIAPDLRCVADAERLRRAVVNVVNNAAQAVEPDAHGDDAVVTVSAGASGGRVELRVADRGPGIPAHILERVFEPLFSTKGFGVGLGLPIVRNIMHQHRGDVAIVSAEGRGTTVTLWLPAGAWDERARTPLPWSEGENSTPVGGAGP